jgi:hypothetical protein
MNPVIERHVLHVAQVMRATIRRCVVTLDVDHAHRGLNALLEHPRYHTLAAPLS